MVEIWQTENDLPHERLFCPLGHMRVLLCRKHAQHFMRRQELKAGWLEERTGDFASTEDIKGLTEEKGTRAEIQRIGSYNNVVVGGGWR